MTEQEKKDILILEDLCYVLGDMLRPLLKDKGPVYQASIFDVFTLIKTLFKGEDVHAKSNEIFQLYLDTMALEKMKKETSVPVEQEKPPLLKILK